LRKGRFSGRGDERQADRYTGFFFFFNFLGIKKLMKDELDKREILMTK
jgi:hypothetical protein